MSEMIYDFEVHSLYYEDHNINVPIFSLAIDTLEMIFELKTGRLCYVQGFFPIVNSKKCRISIPICSAEGYTLQNIDLSLCKQNEVYDLKDKIPQTEKYFTMDSIKYDVMQGIIQLGGEFNFRDVVIKVNENIICVIDDEFILKGIYIIPNRFI